MAPHSHPILVANADESDPLVWRETYENPLFYADASLGPQGYVAFLREQLAALKAAEPELAHRDRVRRAAAAWRDWKRAVRKAARG
jgi:hypothetical protein